MNSIPQDDISNRVLTTIANILKADISELKPQSRFTEELGADSLDKITLLMALEDEFGGSISDHDATGLTTVNSVIEYIHSASGAAKP